MSRACHAISSCLSQLLLDEEGPQMRQLPGTSRRENSDLNQSPADNARVGGLGLVTELGLTLLIIMKKQDQ